MTSPHTIHCLGYATGIAAADPSCCMGPLTMQLAFTEQANQLPPLTWRDMLYPLQDKIAEDKTVAVAEINERLARHTCELTTQGEPFLVVGGDHSSAIGTWSGAAHALAAQGDLGLLWIDAHMDSHTPETTLTHNIHGMPVATLLGYGHSQLTQLLNPRAKVRPDKLCMVGIRDFEPAEEQFLQKLGVKIYFMDEVKQRGLGTVLQEAKTLVSTGTAGYGITLDIDGIDPADAPGTGLHVAGGIEGQLLCGALQQFRGDPKLVGFEIAEFNPRWDQDHKTEKLIIALVNSVFVKQ
jgi:arginase